MLQFIFLTYLVPLVIELPWLLTSAYFFFVVLHVLGRVRLFSNTTYSFLPRETASELRSYTQQQEQRYVFWCISALVSIVMIGVLEALFADVTQIRMMAIGALVSIVLALVYAPFYHDKTELLGNWSLAWLRGARLWSILRWYFNFTPIYMRQAPPDLPDRDEYRQTMKHRHSPSDRLDDDIKTMDTRAFLACRFEPYRFFTTRRLTYEEILAGERASVPTNEVMGPHARRPRIYAMHPHGLATVTAIFGAMVYGEYAMLPDANNVRVAVADVLFYIPLIREFILACGCISASPAAISHSLSRGRDVVILPGGMLEQAMTDYREVELVWNRFGFCRMAYTHRASIVPICAFGENETFLVFNLWPRLRLRNYRRFGYAFPWFFIGPLPANVTPVIGLPLDTERPRRTDAARLRVQRYMDRNTIHPDDVFGARRKGNNAEEEGSDGDTPLVDLRRVSTSIVSHDDEDLMRPVDDYYGGGYANEDMTLLGQSGWSVECRDELRDDKGFVTVLDTTLDETSLIESSYIADLHRAFYAQFVDMRDAASFALPSMFREVDREKWGKTYADLRERLNRGKVYRKF